MSLSSLSRAQVAAAGVVFALLAAAGGYWLGGRGRSMPAPESTSVEGRRVLYWHDPMVPNVKFDKPGKSPYMDMQLVPVYADESHSSEGVAVSPNISQSLGVRLGTVEKRVLDSTLDAVGAVAFDEDLVAVVPARVEGYVTRLDVRAPLTRVRRGQPLAEIQAPAWLEAQQEYLALLDAGSEVARSLRGAARERLRVLGVPESTIQRIETTRKALPTTTIVAPIDGVVTELNAREGAAFMPGAPLFRVNGTATVWVNARIPEARVARIAPASVVTATATAWPGVSFKGQVLALLPEVDAQTRTLTARVRIADADERLAPGMFVDLHFAARAAEPQLVAPTEAIIATGARTVVIVRNPDGAFGVAAVTTGDEVGGDTVILAGLTEGQSIVLSGQFLIDSEASLRSTITRLEQPQ